MAGAAVARARAVGGMVLAAVAMERVVEVMAEATAVTVMVRLAVARVAVATAQAVAGMGPAGVAMERAAEVEGGAGGWGGEDGGSR